LQIPVPKFSGSGFLMHVARCTGEKEFRGQQRNDWVWVRRHPASGGRQPNLLNGRIPGSLNALFKLTSKEGMVYRLAHVTLLQCLGGAAVRATEGMVRVGLPTCSDGVVV
ncbi:hypothetical protein EV426DRAFT_520186, partial [Tirmania nivea]